jgi:predicted kinase
MTLPTLVIFSGLPGAGKSTLAAQLASRLSATYLRIDTIEQGLREICGLTNTGGSGYELAHRIAQENLMLGNNVVADSVNPWHLTRDGWNRVALDAGARYVNVEVVCTDEHEHKRRVETRIATVPGLKLPTWQDVLQRDYQPWSGQRIVVDTAGKSADHCLTELLSAKEFLDHRSK